MADVVRAGVAAAVDEEGGRAGDAAEVGGLDVLRDACGARVAPHVAVEALQVEAEPLGVPAQVGDAQPALVVEEQVVHGPERALLGGRLRGLGGDLGPRVDVGERQVPPHVADVVAEVGEQGADGGLRAPAVGAFEVAVLDDGDGGVVRPAHLVASGVDGHREVDQGFRAAEQGPAALRLGEAAECGGHRPGQQGGTEQGGEDADLRLGEVPAVEGERRDQQGHGESDTRDGAARADRAPADGRADPAPGRGGRGEGGAEYGGGLAEDESAGDAPGDGRGEGAVQLARADPDARVGEGEQRHHGIAGPRVEGALEPFVGGDRRGEAAPGGAFELGGGLLAEAPEQPARAFEVVAGRGVGVGQQSHHEAGDHGVDARFEEGDPDGERQDRVPGALPQPGRADGQDEGEEADGGQQRGQRDVAAVGEGDHGEGDEVVHHGDREDEGAQPWRQPAAPEQGEDPEGEGGVRGHGGPPAVLRAVSRVEGEVDQRGHGEAARARDERQRDAAPVAQLAHVELAPRLKADDEEEQRHQTAVDPLAQAERDAEGPDPYGEDGVPDRPVRAGVRVRPHQCRNHGREEDGRAARLGAQEVAPRGADAVPALGPARVRVACPGCRHAAILPPAPRTHRPRPARPGCAAGAAGDRS
ncbi:hypothetical protein GCM10023082_08040 [Streptomyces tremellae]|uniref:Uncharacterized protein n=1 Tax=Streptomyces tremellae TaxID=1124239 RepID=A0ABP7E2Y2_9ACTN